jgi:hypothetical protein
MDVAPGGDGADLDAGDEPEAGVARRGPGGVAAAGGVVVGDADDGEARAAGAGNELRRRERAVGGGGMKMKVDQRAVKR